MARILDTAVADARNFFRSVIAGTNSISASSGTCAGFTKTLVQSQPHLPSVLNLKLGEERGAEEKGAQVLGKAYLSAA